MSKTPSFGLGPRGVFRRRARAIHNSVVADSVLAQIQREVGSWDGVTMASHRYGGVEFRLGRRELGHLHGSRLADLPFPVAVRNQLIASGRAEPHHILPDSGWVSRRIYEDADAVIALFRLNYERPWLTRQA
jgi:hypothetical protein